MGCCLTSSTSPPESCSRELGLPGTESISSSTFNEGDIFPCKKRHYEGAERKVNTSKQWAVSAQAIKFLLISSSPMSLSVHFLASALSWRAELISRQENTELHSGSDTEQVITPHKPSKHSSLVSQAESSAEQWSRRQVGRMDCIDTLAFSREGMLLSRDVS